MHAKQAMAEELATFMEQLRSEVANYLSYLQALRQERADNLEAMLNQNKNERMASMQTLFDHLAEFRSELHHFHVDLQQSVFGVSMTPTVPSEATAEDAVSMLKALLG